MATLTTAALAAVIHCTASLAGDHAFKLHNNLTKPITKGEVSGFKAIAPGPRLTFAVTIPEVPCLAAVSAFRQGRRTDGRVNIYDKDGYVLDVGSSGPKFLPLSQVMLVH